MPPRTRLRCSIRSTRSERMPPPRWWCDGPNLLAQGAALPGRMELGMQEEPGKPEAGRATAGVGPPGRRVGLGRVGGPTAGRAAGRAAAGPRARRAARRDGQRKAGRVLAGQSPLPVGLGRRRVRARAAGAAPAARAAGGKARASGACRRRRGHAPPRAASSLRRGMPRTAATSACTRGSMGRSATGNCCSVERRPSRPVGSLRAVARASGLTALLGPALPPRECRRHEMGCPAACTSSRTCRATSTRRH
mmetsp:Transcript_24217/g.76105  ORF Transcript_24217/g.76105 Transcript_24217/m.76105 type:complete len:250 (+) Transcript_24217:112-861(+)